MKAGVLRRFRDKHNGKIYKAGDVITISRDRFKEILTVGNLVEEVKTKKTAE